MKTGRHDWLRLMPAYSVKVVEEIIKRYGRSLSVLDPFCGTGTTALSAANHGHDVATTDINPFLTWLARVKTAHYSAASLVETERIAKAALDLARREVIELGRVDEFGERGFPPILFFGARSGR